MYSTNANIIVEAKDIWSYFQEHRAELLHDMVTVAENDDFDVIIYLTNDGGKPSLMIESSNVQSTEYSIDDEASCEATVAEAYDTYLTDKIIEVIAEEEMEADLELEATMEEREADITSFFERLIEDLFPDEPILYTDLMSDLVEDCKEHLLEWFYRKHGLSVYRPMELEDDEGVFVEDYPYEYMEFEPSPLYDDFEVTDLAINGKDIMSLGVPQGKQVGDTLEMVRKFVVGGIFPNDRDILIKRLKSINSLPV